MKRITRDRITNLFSREGVPVLEIEPGEEILFETLDANGGHIHTEEDGLRVFVPREEANPATGPVFVRGAEAGDSLIVEILNIKLGAQGYTRIKPGSGVIIDELEPPRCRIVKVEGDTLVFSPQIRFPVRPMVGVIGTAPAGEAVYSFYPGPHGGNLDINDIAVGARVYLPVNVAGALLCIGDVHASMGDGELTGGGVDIPAEVSVRANVLKGRRWPRPWVETPTSWVTCANAPDLPGAIRLATSDMATFLAERFSISREEGFMLIGTRGDARPGQAAELGMDATARLIFPRLT
ncbi:MAG: acetamidase/formamidase family protein [Dehalococcoidales bacterium]|nr:acetamidase/formamidase family protein [Dehalococcoidales bacterium]